MNFGRKRKGIQCKKGKPHTKYVKPPLARAAAAYFDSFAAYYEAGLALGGMDRVPVRYIWTLTGQQKQAAYHAGEQDAVELIANEGIDAGFAENPEESLDLPQEQPAPMEAGSQGKDGLTPGQTGNILAINEQI